MALIHSILMGAVAGMRAMTPLATITNAACNGTLPRNNGAPPLMSNRLTSTGAKLLAAGELAGDKMEHAPDRIVPAGMLARVATGAIVGMALAPREQRPLAAVLGAGAAVGMAYLTFSLRVRAMRRFGQKATGAVEDAIAVGSATLIARSAAPKRRRFLR
ncbi:conserved hypothetical protein [Luteimonas sp. 9C]|uniref:DUF4126 family protein n=1 Tax=Luteimonas sp. 9C TaxID=2653148 RepID=UPI0012F00EB2|nr:DUF4126 family protein [Luteimonas sp. 9C]VXB31848.1 conserved hypothetical protein [Luteimonas sp. 9C]